MHSRAFTLVELLVVIAIIGLLSTVAVVSMTGARSKARDTKWLADKNQIIKALTLYYYDNNAWPSTGGAIRCFGASSSEWCWKGAYNGQDTLVTAMSPYMASFPKTGAELGTYAYDRFLYMSDFTLGSVTGSWVLWPKENTMTSADCPSIYIYHYDKYWYCYDYLGS